MNISEYNTLLWELNENVLTITINRAKKLNSINLELVSEFRQILQEIRDSPDVHAVVVTGDGDRAFCSGGDINEFVDLSPLAARKYSREGKKFFTSLATLGKPVIAAVNGFALAGGLELVLAADVAFASEDAQFGHPEINFALIPMWGGTQRLTRLVGTMRAKELIFSGRLIGPDEALDIGLINRIVPQKRLLVEAQNFANDLAHKNLTALRLAKQAINSAEETDINTGMALETALFGLCFTEDAVKTLTEEFIAKKLKKPVE
ncbi:MAG: enoyl-CoA hydratase/isomerase family protein [Candidatus Ranarchaeia archaeon]|jgi:enoyl-CoA hydratase